MREIHLSVTRMIPVDFPPPWSGSGPHQTPPANSLNLAKHQTLVYTYRQACWAKHPPHYANTDTNTDTNTEKNTDTNKDTKTDTNTNTYTGTNKDTIRDTNTDTNIDEKYTSYFSFLIS